MAKPNLPKGTRLSKKWDFPPDIFWISPEGVTIDVIGHVTAMQGSPDTFGLPASPVSKKEIDEAFRNLWAGGWVRGRFSSGTFSLQMDRPRGTPLGNAFDMILHFQDHAEEVDISFSDPEFESMGKSMAAKDFLEQRFPTAWRINPGRGRR